MPKTQKQVIEDTTKAIEETRADRQTEGQKQDRLESATMKSSSTRVAAALPNMPGPKPGGLAESLADPNRLNDSLEKSRQRRADYEDAKVKVGIKDVRMPGNTPPNKAYFAEGATAPAGTKMTINENPRFAKPVAPAAEPPAAPVAKRMHKK